jgi:hypothetical protein
MITPRQWDAMSHLEFERLSLSHVRDIYPDLSWTPTSQSHDGGRDGEGSRLLDTGIREIYWMEAKHRPRDNSIGPYTLDTHLVSLFFAKYVKRLHVVTSGRLSTNFMLRAEAFSRDHGFAFSFSDCEVLATWLKGHPETLSYFRSEQESVAEILAQLDIGEEGLTANAFFIPEDDSLRMASQIVDELVPGRKYLLVIAISISNHRFFDAYPLCLSWRPDPRFAYPLDPSVMDKGIEVPYSSTVMTVPFRLLQYGREHMPPPVLTSRSGSPIPLRMRKTSIIPTFASPFVGTEALNLLSFFTKLIREEVKASRPRLIALRGRAGTGKSRLAQELRDEAQHLGFLVRMLPMRPGIREQEDRWRSFFRWLFGIENNPFHLREPQLLKQRLASLSSLTPSQELLTNLESFLVEGKYCDDLFDRTTVVGMAMIDAIDEALRALPGPLLLQIDDVHHLSQRTFSPLYALEHIIQTRDSLAFCLFVTSRFDETVLDLGVGVFLQAMGMGGVDRSLVESLPEFTTRDAQELVTLTLRWPELRTEHSEVLSRIIDRAGTNAFCIMQILEHIAIGRKAVTFGPAETSFLVNVDAFKEALQDIPRGIAQILQSRFDGLRRKQAGKPLLRFLCCVSLFGREIDKKTLTLTRGKGPGKKTIRELLELGFLVQTDESRVALSHDLLVDALRKQPEISEIAKSIAERLGVKNRETIDISDERLSSLYFHAGSAYFRESWGFAERAIWEANGSEDYQAMMAPISTLRKIKRATHAQRTTKGRQPSLAVFAPEPSFDLRFLFAIADQHCGNTKSALKQFKKLVFFSKSRLALDPAAITQSIESAIEAANQQYLRLELSSAKEDLSYALDALAADTDLPQRHDLLALCMNRYGAILQVSYREREAEEAYLIALKHAKTAENHYMMSHTLSDLGSLLRQRDPSGSEQFFLSAWDIYRSRLQGKERRRIMLECSKYFSEALCCNSRYSRAALYSLAKEAMERNFVFQASEALICGGYNALAAGEWEEANRALVKALDLSAISEDLKARCFAYHYLSLSAARMGLREEAAGYAWQASLLVEDPFLADSELRKALGTNLAKIQASDLEDLNCLVFNFA